MRPRRIARRFLARFRHWGIPHVHCPSCGSDNPVPDDPALRTCYTCHIRWFRFDLGEEDAEDWTSLRARADREEDGEWLATWRPLLVDVPDGAGGKTTARLPCAFVYYPGTLP